MSGLLCYDPQIPVLLSDTTPPQVNATGAAGVSSKASRDDHTHVSSIFKQIYTTDASGNISWTYPVGMFLAPPVVQLTVEDPSGLGLSSKLITNTATGGSATVVKTLLGTLLGAGIKVHVYAAKAWGT